MKKTAFVLAIIFALSVSVGVIARLTGFSDGEQIDENAPVLLFEDNFDFLDLTKWKLNPFPENKRRAAYYHEDNVFTENGELILRMNYRESGEYGAGWYAGWVETSRFVQLEYAANDYQGFSTVNGYFEFRARADWVRGAWSAIWLQPDNSETFGINDIQGTGTDGAEIDIMETNSQKNFNTHVVHYDGYDSRLKSVKSGLQWVKDMDEYHNYGFEWTETEYRFYIDGELTFTTSSMGVSMVEQYIILSNEVGGYNDETGMYPGINPDGSVFWFGSVDTEYNRGYYYDIVVDYIRVYDKKPT